MKFTSTPLRTCNRGTMDTGEGEYIDKPMLVNI